MSFIVLLLQNTRHNDFAYTYHPDESGKVLQITRGTRNYHHPLLMLSITDVVLRATFMERSPERVARVGRTVCAVFAAGSVVLLALLGFSLYGPPVGWGVAVTLSLQADLLLASHFMKEDPLLVFGLAATLFAMQRWWQRPDAKTLRLLAVACGLAAGGKYVGVFLVVLAGPLVWFCAAADPLFSRKRRLREFAIWFALTFLLCNLPLFAIHLSSPFRSIHREFTEIARGGNHGVAYHVPHATYLSRIVRNYPLPILIFTAIFLGSLALTAKRRTPAEWMLATVPLVYLTLISFSPKVASRYLLPVSVLCTFLSVLGIEQCSRWLSRPLAARAKNPLWPNILKTLVFLSCTAWTAAAEWPEYLVLRESLLQDDPAALATWVKNNLPREAIIAEDHAVNLSSLKVYGLAAQARIPQQVWDYPFISELGTLPQMREKGVTHVAVSEQAYGGFFTAGVHPGKKEEALFFQRKAFYEQLFRKGRLLKEWHGGRVIPLQPGLRLYDISAPPTLSAADAQRK